MFKLDDEFKSPTWTNTFAFASGALIIFFGHLFLKPILSAGSPVLFSYLVLGLSAVFALFLVFLWPNLTWTSIMSIILLFFAGQIIAGIAKITFSFIKVGGSDIDAYLYIMKASAHNLILGTLYSTSMWALVLTVFNVSKRYWRRP